VISVLQHDLPADCRDAAFVATARSENKNPFFLKACAHVQQFYFADRSAWAVRPWWKSSKLRPLIARGESVEV
jgi:hypothetical protein